MPRHLPPGIPQILAISALSKEGKVNLKKAVRQHLGLSEGGSLFLSCQGECLLSTSTSSSSSSGQPIELEIDGRSRAVLPAQVLSRLEAGPGDALAFVQRHNAAAVKRVEVTILEGEHARLVDAETMHAITRTIETNPMPDHLLPQLSARSAGLRLRYDARAFLSGRQTLEAWKARRLLGWSEPADDWFGQALIDERLNQQAGNGSWDDHLLLTARYLRELVELGLTSSHPAVQRAAAWLLDRPQSPHNPGMFFASDELVAEQIDLVARKQRGVKGLRFRAIKSSEKKRVMSGDDLIQAPCGPRIMWPNALVLDALLRLGYHDHGRVQAALQMMRTHDWCECGYQHGTSGWRQAEPLTDERIATFERECVNQYRYGGLRDAEILLKEATLADGGYLRQSREPKVADRETYALSMPDHIQGCEFITTRALAFVQDGPMRRFAEAHLWRFAGLQHPDGTFPGERYGTGFDQIGILEAFARYDHPASRVVLLRALPWVVAAQNEEGSWGQEPLKDSATWAVLAALLSLGDALPPGFLNP